MQRTITPFRITLILEDEKSAVAQLESMERILDDDGTTVLSAKALPAAPLEFPLSEAFLGEVTADLLSRTETLDADLKAEKEAKEESLKNAESLTAELATCTAELATATERIATLEAAASTANESRIELERTKAEAESSLASRTSELESSTAKVAELEARILELTAVPEPVSLVAETITKLHAAFSGTLPGDAQAAFAMPYAIVRVLVEAEQYALAAAVIQGIAVPPELEEAKANLISLLPK